MAAIPTNICILHQLFGCISIDVSNLIYRSLCYKVVNTRHLFYVEYHAWSYKWYPVIKKWPAYVNLLNSVILTSLSSLLYNIISRFCAEILHFILTLRSKDNFLLSYSYLFLHGFVFNILWIFQSTSSWYDLRILVRLIFRPYSCRHKDCVIFFDAVRNTFGPMRKLILWKLF